MKNVSKLSPLPGNTLAGSIGSFYIFGEGNFERSAFEIWNIRFDSNRRDWSHTVWPISREKKGRRKKSTHRVEDSVPLNFRRIASEIRKFTVLTAPPLPVIGYALRSQFWHPAKKGSDLQCLN